MAGWEEELGLNNVLPFDRPMTAGSKDRIVGQDELGQTIYETPTGQRYTVRPATEEESKTTRAKAEEWVEEGAPLPSWGQIVDTMKAIPGAMYDSAASAVRGEGTVGDALAIVPTSGAAGMATRIGQEFDPNVLSAMGATHRVPSYKPVDELAQKALVHDEYGNTYNKIEFSNPLKDILAEMEVPNNGLKGSQLIKELQDNPTVRNSQLRSEDWLESIDPQKRYTKEEIQGLMEGKGWQTYAAPANRYSGHQRQYNLVDPEVKYDFGGPKYVEYAIQSVPNYDQRGFRANSQHYTDDTVAHIRLSERSGNDGNYVLVEELQSDLLQQGFQKPSRDWEEAKKEYLKSVSDPTRFHIYNRLEKDDLLEYGTLVTESVNGLITDKEFVSEVDKLLDKLQKRVGLEGNRFIRGDIYDVLMEANEIIPPNNSSVTYPPVAKTEETVKLGLQTAMAHAYNKGITKVVIPPFDEIVAKRFDRGSAQFDQAMDPKSGFYATYVKGVQKVLRNMQEEFGDKIRVTNRDMEYDPNKKENDFEDWEPEPLEVDGDFIPNWKPETPEEMFFSATFRAAYEDVVNEFGLNVPTNFGRETFNSIDRIGEKIVNRGDLSVREALGEDSEVYDALRSSLADAYPNVRVLTALQSVADEGISFTEALFKQVAPKPKLEPKTEIKQGIEIDFSGLVNEGYDLSRPRFATGGMVEQPMMDPVSKNPVPTGATPKEVRDDVPIMASEGEYVIPANVVRYLGLDKIEKLVNQAKKGLEELEMKGRIGGQTEEDLPFSAEELQTVDQQQTAPNPQATPKMATGGMVLSQMETDPATGLPLWLVQMQRRQRQPQAVAVPGVPSAETPAQPTESVTNDRGADRQPNTLTGLAADPKEWDVNTFNRYATARTGIGQNVGQAFASLVPFGGIASRARERYLERTVPTQIEKMLSTGKDVKGNPLSTEQMGQLRNTLDTIRNEPVSRIGGAAGVARAIGQDLGLIRRRDDTTPAPSRTREKPQQNTSKSSGKSDGSSRPVSRSSERTTERRESKSKQGNTAR